MGTRNAQATFGVIRITAPHLTFAYSCHHGVLEPGPFPTPRSAAIRNTIQHRADPLNDDLNNEVANWRLTNSTPLAAAATGSAAESMLSVANRNLTPLLRGIVTLRRGGAWRRPRYLAPFGLRSADAESHQRVSGRSLAPVVLPSLVGRNP
jgi:hypothetical protein